MTTVLNKYNRAFNFSMTELMNIHVYKQLVNEKRVFITTAKFYEWEATQIIGDAPEEWPYSVEGFYSGLIVTDSPDDFLEARRIAKQRGYNETVDGVLALRRNNDFVFEMN